MDTDFWKPHMKDRENRYGEMFMKTVGPRLFPEFGGQLFTKHWRYHHE
jgi:hypothetical protein